MSDSTIYAYCVYTVSHSGVGGAGTQLKSFRIQSFDHSHSGRSAGRANKP